MAKLLGELDPDVFIFAGDVSPNRLDVKCFLEGLVGVKASKFFVCGNHDIWVSIAEQIKGHNSFTKYCSDLRKLCEKNDFHYLQKQPIIISDTAFAGTIGWYDYSTRNESLDHVFSMQDYVSNQSFVGSWNDGQYAYWTKNPESLLRLTDIEVSRVFCSDLADQLLRVRGKVKQAVAVTHIVPFKELVRYKGDPYFDFFSAFIGNVNLGKVIADSKIVKYAVCGHTHFPAEIEIGSVQCACSPIGYLNDFQGDLGEYIAERLKCFEL